MVNVVSYFRKTGLLLGVDNLPRGLIKIAFCSVVQACFGELKGIFDLVSGPVNIYVWEDFL
jgi:hypothetical protein